MAKYIVNHSCGHEAEHQLFGKETERQSRIKWLETKECSACYAERIHNEMLINHDVVEMNYRDYKNNYSTLKTVPDSYDAESKTVKVYIKKV